MGARRCRRRTLEKLVIWCRKSESRALLSSTQAAERFLWKQRQKRHQAVLTMCIGCTLWTSRQALRNSAVLLSLTPLCLEQETEMMGRVTCDSIHCVT